MEAGLEWAADLNTERLVGPSEQLAVGYWDMHDQLLVLVLLYSGHWELGIGTLRVLCHLLSLQLCRRLVSQ